MLAPSTVGGVNVSCPFHKLDRANLELLGSQGAPGGVTTATVINPRFAPVGFVVAGRVATDAIVEQRADRRKSSRPVLRIQAATRVS